MIELFAHLRQMLLPRSSPFALPCSSPIEQPPTSVDPEMVTLPGLAKLPIELFLQIIQHLPIESAAAVALMSKHHYVALREYVLPGLRNRTGKKRFLRLLEIDLAEYIACHCCDRLYRWNASVPQYECPRRHDERREVRHAHTLRPQYCPQHHPGELPLEAVAAFLRGYERGPAYGPQLEELHHKCDGALPWHHRTPEVSRDTAARVVTRKLLLRVSYTLQLSLQRSLVTQLDQLKYLGCSHCWNLPGIVMDAIIQLGTPVKAPRCSDYIKCAECATDLRVAVLDTGNDQLAAQIITWQCYGGRDIDQEDHAVQIMFGFFFACKREDQNYRGAVPSRNLELLYDGNFGDGGSLTNTQQQRHS